MNKENRMKYWSMDISGIYHEWEDFDKMVEYYNGYPRDRWEWGGLK